MIPIRSGFQIIGRCSVVASGTQCILTAIAMVLLGSHVARAEVKVHGATTVAFGLMSPNKVRIEKMTGVELTIFPSSTTHGLKDLIDGKADIAMLAQSLETAVEELSEENRGRVSRMNLIGTQVGSAVVQFIVHPSNAITRLSKAQLADIYSGKVNNWSELGGKDLPIIAVGEPTSSPYRMIRDVLAISYRLDLRIVQNTNQSAVIVAQAPGAISNISTAHNVPQRDRLRIVETEVTLPLQLCLAYRKDAGAEVQRVVRASIEVAKP
jgi:phosphate transport system substrate-binding protein